MAELSRFWGIVVAVFLRGEERHGRPHVHVFSGGEGASVAIDNCEILAGKLSRTTLRLLKIWMKLHRAELYEAWETIRAGGRPRKIKPLTAKRFK